MKDFRKQIKEDINDYQEMYPNLANIKNDEWAFNFWILDKLFSEDENVIEAQITDYSDRGTDCYVWHEDTHDLYLIQNKYYSDNSSVKKDYVLNSFLLDTISSLENGSYSRSKDLQTIYNKFSGYDDFMIYQHLYITNNCQLASGIMEGIDQYNLEHQDKRRAKIFNLNQIEELYYKEPITETKSLNYAFITPTKGQILNTKSESPKLALATDAKYILTPILSLYGLCKAAEDKNYQIYEENIREYLGSNGSVNKKIMRTLNDPEDRKNFFYYNNGITMIVDEVKDEGFEGGERKILVKNPQIVNGCQTVSTINEALSCLPEDKLEEQFDNVSVMVKILEIPKDSKDLTDLYHKIVEYNNSQNSINDKMFVATDSDEFLRIQTEFERKGFLVCVKQSDKYQFLNKYNNPRVLLDRCDKLLEKFSLKDFKKTKNFYIDLERLLQIILAFVSTTQDAIQNKSKLLKNNTRQNESVIEFIRSADVTVDSLIHLYLLFARSEQERKNSPEKRIPIPLYLINCFSRYDCKNDPEKITILLQGKDKINKIIKLYSGAINAYYRKWNKLQENKDNNGYNAMIKAPLNVDLMDSCVEDAIGFMEFGN